MSNIRCSFWYIKIFQTFDWLDQNGTKWNERIRLECQRISFLIDRLRWYFIGLIWIKLKHLNEAMVDKLSTIMMSQFVTVVECFRLDKMKPNNETRPFKSFKWNSINISIVYWPLGLTTETSFVCPRMCIEIIHCTKANANGNGEYGSFCSCPLHFNLCNIL